MDNVLQDMVQRLRAIELLLRTQNELLTRVLSTEHEQTVHTRRRVAVRLLPLLSRAIGLTCREAASALALVLIYVLREPGPV